MADTNDVKEPLQCKPEDHDRFVYNQGEGDEAPIAEDGLLGCHFCGEPAFYCRNAEWYFHVNVSGREGDESPAHNVADGHPFLDPELDATGIPVKVAEQPE